MRTHARDYIWNYKLQFGDWVALDAAEGSYYGATPNDLTCTAYFAYSTGLFVKICRILRKTEEAEEYDELYHKIRSKFQKTFFNADGTMTAHTQTAHIVSLCFDLVPEAFREKTAAGLKKLLSENGGHLLTGFVGTPYFCHALSGSGYTEEAYDLLLKEDFPSWLFQVKMGATTIWEHWDGLRPDGTMWSPDMNSFNHYAYGAVGEWLYRVCAGIEIDENAPGYRHIFLNPHPTERMDYARAEVRTVHGKVSCGWKREGTEAEVTFEIPANTSAHFAPYRCAEILEAGGLVFTEADGVLLAEAGSGSYTVIYRMK